MKSTLRSLVGLISLLLVGLFLLWPIPNTDRPRLRAPQQTEAGYSFENTRLGQAWNSVAQSQDQQGPIESEPVSPDLSPAVRDLPMRQPGDPVLDREINPRQNPAILNIDPDNPDPYDTGEPDPLIQYSRNPSGRTPALDTNFAGMGLTSGGGGVPPDTIGDVGPNHYVQMVNVAFAIFDKDGTNLAVPTDINQLWTGQGNDCETSNDGDPIVLYDRLADRWLLAQFRGSPAANGLCIAISTSSDPTGAYYLYSFNTGEFPDYFKVGVWPDAYYVSANESSYTAYAFDRANMLSGNPATFVKFTGQSNLLLPADFDGATAPPAGSPGYFYTFKDNSFHGGGGDRLEIFEFDVNFGGGSTFTLVDTINISSFTYTVCGFFNLNCIPQPSTSRKLDPVSEWPMWRLQYRNFGTHETLVGNFTVDVGSDRAGIRWFELRKQGAGWTLYQEGTHAPDSDNRWMGSIAMDQTGNVALGYSVSSSSTRPSIRYATRLSSDPLGTLQTEATLQAGVGSQTAWNRWGDYSSMNVDPADDCTFWYTNEYANASGFWQTRVGSFRIPDCGGISLSKQVSDRTPNPGQTITFTIVVANNYGSNLTNAVISDTMPAGVNFVGPVVLDPSGAGIVGINPPILVSSLTVTSGENITVTFPVTVSALTGTVIINSAAITSTEIPAPTTGSGYAFVGGVEIYLPVTFKN